MAEAGIDQLDYAFDFDHSVAQLSKRVRDAKASETLRDAVYATRC